MPIDFTDVELAAAVAATPKPKAGPSRHLSFVEMGCYNHLRDRNNQPVVFEGVQPGGLIAPYPPIWYAFRLSPLSIEFEAVRQLCCDDLGRDARIDINSSYRTATYNRAIKGAPLSQHAEGRALDLVPPKGMSLDRFFELCLLRAKTPGSKIRGLARYFVGRFVHLDVRPTDVLVMWNNSTRPALTPPDVDG